MMGVSDGPLNNRIQWQRPDEGFYTADDVLKTARALIGMKLVSLSGNMVTAGIITETEAYAGVTDRASHAFGGRRTARTETMYRQGGVAYIYLCYGIHSLINVVTGKQGNPHAVLIRGVIPVEGLAGIRERTGNKHDLIRSGTGPGKVSKLLGIDCSFNGTDLLNGNELWIERSDFRFSNEIIGVTSRIGVDYAGDDAMLPYRFFADLNPAAEEIKKAGFW